MAQLLVRKLPGDIVRKLRMRASRNKRSAEEEHRAILREALRGPGTGFKDLLREMPAVGDDVDFERRADRGREVPL